MQSLRLLAAAMALIVLLPGMAGARLVRTWSDQELFDKSDLVVTATPVATNDTKERGGHPNCDTQPIIGVETTFAVSAVFKGDQAIKRLVLHHYRADKVRVPNAPTFVSFDLHKGGIFRLFLVRQSDGRYMPVAGQNDPGLSLRDEAAKRSQ